MGTGPETIGGSCARREYQAGHGTIRRALGRLQDEGLIVTLPRYGTFRSGRDPAKD